jgi:hypothetical protein
VYGALSTEVVAILFESVGEAVDSGNQQPKCSAARNAVKRAKEGTKE